MKLLLQCNQCGSTEEGNTHGTLMNKIKMWNHLKREHPMLAERIVKTHDTMPTSFYRELELEQAIRMGDVRPRWLPI